jgi:hypothetical protein
MVHLSNSGAFRTSKLPAASSAAESKQSQPHSDQAKMFAIDCEMCYTKEGACPASAVAVALIHCSHPASVRLGAHSHHAARRDQEGTRLKFQDALF